MEPIYFPTVHYSNVDKLFSVCSNNPKRILLDLERSIVKDPPTTIMDVDAMMIPEKKENFILLRITKKHKAVFVPESVIKSEVYFDFYRQNLAEKKICAYCGECAFLTKEHILPKSFGYTMNKKNKVMVCASCNRRKDNRCLGQWLMDEIGNPFISKRQWIVWFENVNRLIACSKDFLHPDIMFEWYSFFPETIDLRRKL
jgi:hypothetical protein